MATRLADGLRDRGYPLLGPVEANVVFVRLPHIPDGFTFYDWPCSATTPTAS